MGSNEAQLLAMRLLELQQRFEAYVALHEDELRETKVMLKELRKDLLQLNRNGGIDAVSVDGRDEEDEQLASSGANPKVGEEDEALDGAPEGSFLTL
jgi:hypothetical protein